MQGELQLLRVAAQSLLSFPPEASCCSSKDHFKPQTWPTKPTTTAPTAKNRKSLKPDTTRD